MSEWICITIKFLEENVTILTAVASVFVIFQGVCFSLFLIPRIKRWFFSLSGKVVSANLRVEERIKSLTTRADTAFSKEEYENEEKFLREALNIISRHHGANTFITADCQHDLALCLSNQTKDDEAESLYRFAVQLVTGIPDGYDEREAKFKGNLSFFLIKHIDPEKRREGEALRQEVFEIERREYRRAPNNKKKDVLSTPPDVVGTINRHSHSEQIS